MLKGTLIDFALYLADLYENPVESRLAQLPMRIVNLLVARYSVGIGASYRMRVMTYLQNTTIVKQMQDKIYESLKASQQTFKSAMSWAKL